MYGESLRQQVEDRLKFYESGEAPRKNVEVMEEAMALAAKEIPEETTTKKKKKKNKRKNGTLDETAEENCNATLDTTNGNNGTIEAAEEDGEPKKKKKKKKNKNKDEE